MSAPAGSLSGRQYTFDLENAISTWRQFLSRDSSLTADDLHELEDHLRLEIEALNREQYTDEERFRIGIKRVGGIVELDSAYSKVIWEKRMQRGITANGIAALGLFGSYLKTAWNSIFRHKVYASLNLLGLTIALSACIVIVLYVQHELNFDSFHSKADRIYRLEMKMPTDTDDQRRWPTAYWPVGPELENSIPEIEMVTRISQLIEPLIQVDDVQFFEDRFLFAEPAFFRVFDLTFTSGTTGEFEAPQNIVLSQSMASKYFPSGDAVGNTILVGERASNQPEEYEVVAVFRDLPANAHFGANFIASFASQGEPEPGNEWYRLAYTYLVLRSDALPSTALDKLDAYWTDHVRDGNSRESSAPALQPLKRIHLFGSTSSDIEPQGDIKYVMMFALVAALLLIVTCVNYVNLAIARYATRAREVGIRKVFGANRNQLIWQFLGESVVYCSISFLLAIAVVALTLPSFNAAMDLSLSLSNHYSTVLKLFIPSIVIVGLLAGSYPALFLSRFTPTSVLKDTLGLGRRAVLRKGLLLFQFVITSCLIVGTVVISEQLKFVQDQKLGFDKEQILILKTRGALTENANAFRSALAQIPSVESVSFAQSFPGRPYAMSWFRSREIEEYEGDTVIFDHVWADTSFVKTVGLEIIAGRAFSADRTGDAEGGVVLNEAAVRALGWTNPLGKRLGEGVGVKEVIGIVRDFHSQSMYQEISPLILEMGSQTSYAGLRVISANLTQTLEAVQNTWEVFIPTRPFEYSFLDDDFKAMYRQETRLGRLFTAFSTLTIIIAIVGLFGLVSFSAQQRTKEIGIRKALGATASNITVLLSREFILLVVVSFLASAPLIYWIMSQWLNQFAYRVELSVGLFILSGAILLSIAMFTVGIQAFRTAIIPPVDCLRE